ncbi:hypothetical protein MMC22_005638 [Lobaria immixta]|nr:hypothetical protein [Lobaria immixta]
MRSSFYLSLAFFAVLSFSAPVPDDSQPGTASTTFPADGVNTLPFATIQTTSTGAKFIVVFSLESVNPGKGGTQAKGHPGDWFASEINPVCAAYCLNGGTDINLRNKFCTGLCSGTEIRRSTVYVTRDAVSGYWGAELTPCAQGVCSTILGGIPIDLAP